MLDQAQLIARDWPIGSELEVAQILAQPSACRIRHYRTIRSDGRPEAEHARGIKHWVPHVMRSVHQFKPLAVGDFFFEQLRRYRAQLNFDPNNTPILLDEFARFARLFGVWIRQAKRQALDP